MGDKALLEKLTEVLSTVDLSEGFSVVMISLDGDIAIATPLAGEDGDTPIGIKLAVSIASVFSEDEPRDQLIKSVYEDGMDTSPPKKGDFIH